MNAWPTEGDAMGPTVTRTASAKTATPPLKNGSEPRETGYLVAVGSRTARFRRKHRNKAMIIFLLVISWISFVVAATMIALYVRVKLEKEIGVCNTKECLRSAANLALSIDRNVDPCSDFYQYSCGNWADDHPRPDEYQSYDWFTDKQTKVYTAVRDLLISNVSHHPKPVQQAKVMYSACMDVDTLDNRGVTPVFNILEQLGLPMFPNIANMTDEIDYNNYTFDWLESVIKIKTHLGMDVLIGFDIYNDLKNSSVYRIALGSPATTNPFPSTHKQKKLDVKKLRIKSEILRKLKLRKTNENYFGKLIFDKGIEHKKKLTDDENQRIERIYKRYYAQLMKIFVLDSESAKNIKLSDSDLDTHLLDTADIYYNLNEDINDLEGSNDTSAENEILFNISDYTIAEIQAHTDGVVENNNGTAMPIWQRYLEGVFNISTVRLDFEKDKVMISEFDLRYMSLMAAYLSKASPAVIELYVWIKVVEVLAVHTTTEIRTHFEQSYMELHNESGVTALPPRTIRCAKVVDDMLGWAIAYAIADPHFLTKTKPKIEIMLTELKNALAHSIGKTRWMDDNTKVETYEKIIEMRTLIGFPETLLEKGKLESIYEGVEVDEYKHLENMINVIQIKVKRALNKFRDTHDYSWATDPTEVNAYHSFQENTITVPMVMLQHPFFDLGLHSLNFGAIGTILGHEITHGFDNYGNQFDKNGNMIPWWTRDTLQMYETMTQCFIKQYSSFYVADVDEHVNGKNTLGENIADNGGLREALAAFKHHQWKYGPEPKLPGFEHLTSEQLFFLSYGNLWCSVTTKESLRADLEDEHSPMMVRVTASLQNLEEFARAWHCPRGSYMNPADKCVIF